MPLAWKEEYSSGEEQVDKQHKVLFGYLEKLEKNMESGVTERQLNSLLGNLGLYTRSHFCYEEICMRKLQCPVSEKNKEQHAKLLDAYVHYLHRFEVEGISDDLVQKLHDFLQSWLVNHILKIDTHLKARIK